MTTNLVDYHCHLDLYPDYESLLEECERKCIHTLTVTTTPKAWPRNYSLTKFTKYVRPALGLHPQLVSERAKEINLWDEHLSEARFIGEVGLDASPRFYSSFYTQLEIFEHVLKKCSRAGNKIITVHSVRSAPKVLDLIEGAFDQRSDCKIVLHWFTGSKSQAKRAVDLGCYFSINNEMLPKHNKLIESIPISRILTETDGPFTGSKEEPLRPCDVVNVLIGLSQLMQIEPSKLKQQINENLFNLES